MNLEKLNNLLSDVNKKLANQQFINKAPKEIIESLKK